MPTGAKKRYIDISLHHQKPHRIRVFVCFENFFKKLLTYSPLCVIIAPTKAIRPGTRGLEKAAENFLKKHIDI